MGSNIVPPGLTMALKPFEQHRSPISFEKHEPENINNSLWPIRLGKFKPFIFINILSIIPPKMGKFF
jgi:hypothetical protein